MSQKSEHVQMIIIFLTGAIVLALEVLASRIMTPYFGVSLYIWAGILSITLTFLAVGYAVGSFITRRYALKTQANFFLFSPVLSALSIVVVCLIYPYWFPSLAKLDLVVGSFIASAALLALPLICLSSMNPILISMRSGRDRVGDGGAGLVFFVSTVGSVVGVLFTAFFIIPNVLNYTALLWLAIALCLVSLVASLAKRTQESSRGRRLLWGSGLLVIASSVVFMVMQEQFIAPLKQAKNSEVSMEVVADYSSMYGNVKVAEIQVNPQAQKFKAILHDGLIQNRTTLDNTSLSMYTYVMDSLALAFAPHAQDGLVLGAGAGISPRDFLNRGIRSTVVDINENIFTAAEEHFGFDPSLYEVHLQDARTYARTCQSGAYDVAIVDLFQGDSTPDYLLTQEFFSDLRRCMRDRGVIVMNSTFDLESIPGKRMLATVSQAFPAIYGFGSEGKNNFLVAAASPVQGVRFSLKSVHPALTQSVRSVLSTARRISPESLAGHPPVTDRHNVFSLLAVESQMAFRSKLVDFLPSRALVN